MANLEITGDLEKDYRVYCEWYAKAWKFLLKYSEPFDKIAEEICIRRNYKDVVRWKKLLKETGLAKVKIHPKQVGLLRKAFPEELGLFGKNGFLLDNTYMIPVRDMLGNIIAIVGWEPGKKYITTPSKYFNKSCLFFGLEQFKDYKYNKRRNFFVVEGIFDSLSLRSLGFRCLGNMGITGSKPKSKIMTLCKKVVAIPDCDKAGRGVIDNDEWLLPQTGSYVVIPNYAKDFEIKDVDDIIKKSEPEDLIKEFAGYFNCTTSKIVMNI